MAHADSSEPGCWLLDLDGVVWLDDEIIEGTADALDRLRSAGCPIAFFTNNSFVKREVIRQKLERVGALRGDLLLSSAEAASRLLSKGDSACVLGGAGIEEALVEQEVSVVDLESAGQGEHVDAVVVGLDLHFDYARLTHAMNAVMQGARLIATNTDATYPTKRGALPGGGAIVGALCAATGVEPVIAGKPYQPAIDLVIERIGKVSLVVGDRPETDGLLAKGLGSRFGLVRSGVTPPLVTPDGPRADFDSADLVSLVGNVLSKVDRKESDS